MKIQAFSTGDVVRLKSGGPLMTVDTSTVLPEVIGDGFLSCLWFIDSSLQSELFDAAELELANPAT